MNTELSQGFGSMVVVLTTAWTILTFIFWMVVGWRAMRAHERIASTLEDRLPR